MEEKKFTETWIDLVKKEFDEKETDLNYKKISIMDSVSHAASLFDLKNRLEDALNTILLEMQAREFFRKFYKRREN